MKANLDVNLSVPDGGWGWIVVASSFSVMFMIDGLFASYGLFLPVLMENFHSTPSVTSLAGSLVVGSLLLVALLVYPLIERFDCRIVAISGALVAAFGLVLSSVAVNIWMFLFTYGIITGCGIGMMYLPSVVMVNRYFNRKRGIVQSITSSGSGLGMIVTSPVVDVLLDVFNFRGTLLILGGCFLQLCVFCALFRPPKKLNTKNFKSLEGNFKNIEIPANIELRLEDKEDLDFKTDILSLKELSKIKELRLQHNTSSDIQEKDHINLLKFERANFNSSTRSLPHHIFNHNQNDSKPSCLSRSTHCIRDIHESNNSMQNTKLLSKKDILYCGSLNHLKLNSEIRLEDMCLYQKISTETNTEETEHDQKLCSRNPFTNKSFWLIAIGAFLTQMAQFIPSMFLGDFGISLGLTSREVSLMLSMFGVVNTIGRLLPGFVIDNTKMSSTFLCTIGMVGCAISCFCFPVCKDFSSLLTFCLFFGFFIALFCPLQPIMVLDSVGLDNLTKGLAVLTALKGPAAIIGPPFAGALYEWTQNYNVTILFAGGLCLLTACVYCVSPIDKYIKSRCRTENESGLIK